MIIQSYYSVIIRCKMDICQMRMFMAIVKRSNSIIPPGHQLQEMIKRGIDISHISRVMSVPIKEIVGNSHNYEPFKASIRKMMNWQVEYYNKQEKQWQIASIMDDVVLNEKDGVVTFETKQWVLDYILDFRNGGVRLYDYAVAMSMHSAADARFYILINSMTKPLSYNILQFKKMLGVESKYKRFCDFEKRVLKKAQENLKNKGLNYFNYEIERKYKDKPKSEPINIKIIPIKVKVNNEKIGEVIKGLKSSLNEQIYSYMVSNVGFTNREMAGNKELFIKLPSVQGWKEKLLEIIERARRKGKNHGYIIKGLWNWLEEKGVFKNTP